MRGVNVHYRGFTWSEIEHLPLIALHAMLARIEAKIEARLEELGGELLQRWNDVRVPDDVRRLWGVDGMETTYFRLAEIVIKREQEELQQLRKEAA